METGRPVANLAITILNAKGNKIPIGISTALLKNKEGRVIGGVETFRDHSVVEQLRRELDGRYSFEYIIGKSPKMQHIFDMIPVVAESDSTVLITGESGTGKGLVARAIHNLSPRSGRPFVTVNCGAIPDTLLESELFGYKAGAFTDARRDKPGRISLAQGGTILLDEIGDICPAIQAKLLRLIQDKVYEPLGGLQSVHADVRIIAATNRNLARLMEEGRFRMDLYYRINVLHLELPPLRERVEDVPLLADHFLKRLSVMKGKDVRGISPEAMAIL
ncbi:MAG: transcriptional regulator with sigma 54 interaction domain, partial [Deltaproteobacteria bacterium]|nr:transcriptional regulator with sigma 54 interaction domain [Deltaproteobacteria bacterium]